MISSIFNVDEDDINTNYITNENGGVAKQAIQIETTLNVIKASIDDELVTNDVILSKLVDTISTATSSSDFNLSDSSNVSSIIDTVSTDTGVTISDNAKANIANYASNINNTIDTIEADQSISKVISSAAQISVASTSLIESSDDAPDFESDTTSFSSNISAVTQQVQTNAAKLIVSNTNIIK